MERYIAIISGLMFFTLELNACKQGESHQAHAATEVAYHIQPKKGGNFSDYYYSIRSEFHSPYEVNDKKIESGAAMEMRMRLELGEDRGNGILAHIVYERLNIVMDNKGEHTDVTARQGNSSSVQIERMPGSVLGSELAVHLE